MQLIGSIWAKLEESNWVILSNVNGDKFLVRDVDSVKQHIEVRNNHVTINMKDSITKVESIEATKNKEISTTETLSPKSSPTAGEESK